MIGRAPGAVGERLGASLRNAWAVSWLGPGLEPDRSLPSTLLYDEPHARVARLAPDENQSGNPVLLVTPLAVPVSCWDLRPGQSLAARLSGAESAAAGTGRPTYAIDYGTMTFADRAMGFEDWVGRILPTAVRRISEAHGGEPVHLVGWSHGGTMSLLLGAHDPDLPIASIVALGTPTDYRLNPMYAPLFTIAGIFGAGIVVAPTALMGGLPAPLTRRAYRWMAPVREVTKPWSLLSNLHRPEVLARIASVDAFISSMPGYPGRFINQALTRIVVGRELVVGRVHLGPDFVVEMDRLRAPLLLIGSTDDVLASAASVEAGVVAYPGSEVSFLQVDGLSHLGLIASPRAGELTWPAIQSHLDSHDAHDANPCPQSTPTETMTMTNHPSDQADLEMSGAFA